MSLSFTKSGMIGKANIGEELLYFFFCCLLIFLSL
jgi:hypothetical protein